MTTDAKRANPFATILQFYLGQAEKITPLIEQGVEDWFSVYNKIWKEGMRLQNEWVKQGTGKERNEFTDQAKDLGVKIIEIQKEISIGLVNVGMKGVKSIIQAAMESKRNAS